jgi:hypothetical protein
MTRHTQKKAAQRLQEKGLSARPPNASNKAKTPEIVELDAAAAAPPQISAAAKGAVEVSVDGERRW